MNDSKDKAGDGAASVAGATPATDKTKVPNTVKSTVDKPVTEKPVTKKSKQDKPSETQQKSAVKAPSETKQVYKKVASTESPNQMTETNPKAEKSSGAGGIAILFSLLALGGTAFTWYQTQVEKVQAESSLAIGVTEIGGEVSRLGDSIARIQKQQDDVVTQDQLGNRLTQLSTRLDASLKQVSDEQTSVTDSVNKINNDLKKGVNAYVLEEVEQLLKLANYSAAFSANKASAMSALSLADNQLKSLSDPRYVVVRTRINQELSLLQSTQQTDIEAISAMLNSVSALVSELPLANEPESSAVSFAETEGDKEITWRTEVAKIWQDIKGSIQIQKVDQPPKPLLAPEQRYFLNQNLQLSLNKAELALLQERQAVYESSLQSAVTWLSEYFDLTDGRVQSVLQQLTSAKTQQVSIALPAITGSYDALQAIKGE